MSSANGLLPIGCTCLIVRATVWHVCRDGHVSSRTGSCVSVFTHGNNGVCKVGHMSGEMGLSVSDCAHGVCACVQRRTHEWRDGLVFVRLCTRSVSVCAKSDTKTVKLSPACPFLHTACVRVCIYGHICAAFAFLRTKKGGPTARTCQPSGHPVCLTQLQWSR